MEPVANQQMRFEGTVYVGFKIMQVQQLLVVCLAIYAFPAFVVINSSTAPWWLNVIVAFLAFGSVITIYYLAKPQLFKRKAYKLVRDEFNAIHHEIRLVSFEYSGRITAMRIYPFTQRVRGVITLAEGGDENRFIEYRIDLLTD
jgi:hypothetical protein